MILWANMSAAAGAARCASLLAGKATDPCATDTMCVAETEFYTVGHRPFGEVAVGSTGDAVTDADVAGAVLEGRLPWWGLFARPPGSPAVVPIDLSMAAVGACVGYCHGAGCWVLGAVTAL
jgi:hypothetical protein